jgi:glyoxylase-like metal-dependent hydrolase (beta-lactamase superfamily II)
MGGSPIRDDPEGGHVKGIAIVVAAVAASLSWSATVAAQGTGKAAERLYVLDCGALHLQDGGRVGPSFAGKPLDLLDSCYLIKTAQGYFLWETGAPDSLATTPAPAGTPLVLSRTTTLAAQLQELGVKPADIKYMAISHTHGDHAGNVDTLPTVPVLMQKAEYDFAFAAGKQPPFSPTHLVEKIEGEKDVFGDGALRIVPTPGHTPGHQSLVVRLAKTGTVVLSGDAVQVGEQLDRYKAAPANYDERLVAGIRTVADLAVKNNAKVWYSHDPAQTQQLRGQKYYE